MGNCLGGRVRVGDWGYKFFGGVYCVVMWCDDGVLR